jgi:phospholipid/cholesterol/gamma-HCH transport system substrate-binding protein
MRTRDVVSFAAFAAIIVFVLGYFATLGIRVKPPSERANLTMEVADINGLEVGSNVLLRGVPVGKVTKTGTSIQAATINFYIEGRYRVPVDSQIRLENLSALGESYISLIPRRAGGAMLHDGQHIAATAVTAPPSISELTTSVVRVLNQLNPPALKRIVGETNTALPDPVAVLPNLSRASTLLRNTVADFHGSGRAVLDNVQTLLKHAEYVAPALTGLTPRTTELGVWVQDIDKQAVVFVDGKPGGAEVANLNKLVRRIQLFLDDRGPDLKVLGEAFQPKLNAIAAALSNFDTGQILDHVLAAVPPDGVMTLRVVP